ncbi:MAG: hypothetical protein RR365_11720 [Bacteroides sp.]
MRKQNGITFLLLTALLLSFTACESDETLFNRLIGRTWVGDLGFSYDHYPVESGLTFKASGFATDEQYFFPEDGGDHAVTLDVRWSIANDILYLDYGNGYPLLEVRGFYVSGRFLNGTLYVDGKYDGPLTMEIDH